MEKHKGESECGDNKDEHAGVGKKVLKTRRIKPNISSAILLPRCNKFVAGLGYEQF